MPIRADHPGFSLRGDVQETDPGRPREPLDLGRLLPHLSRFYGPHDWLSMPTSLLNAYAEQLPRISAEESLQAAERIAVGSGTLKRGVDRRISDGWTRQAGQRRLVIRPKSAQMYQAQMSALGIGVKLVKPDG